MVDMDHNALSLFLKSHPQTDIIKWAWVSCSGSVYAHLLTKARCQNLATSLRPLRPNTSCLAGLVRSSDLSSEFLSSAGHLHVVPDWESLRLISFTEATVQCFLHENTSVYRTLKHPTDRCPRSCLQRVLSIARGSRGFIFLIGFELEFYLLESDSSDTENSDFQTPSLHDDLIPWCSSQRLHGKRADCLRKCMLALEDAGITVEHGHAEGSMFQFEISTGPLQPLSGIDAFYASRDIIKRVALEFSFHATFIPKPFSNSQPSGLHLHLSIHHANSASAQGNLEREGGEIATMFLAGILKRLPALCAISMPSFQSYKRGANEDTMGAFVAWGTENHSVPLNEVAKGHWEVRSMDCTANVFLAVAAYIAAGMLGIDKSEVLSSKDPGEAVERLSAESRIALGITKRLPTTLSEALQELEKNSYDLESLLGHELIHFYLEIKRNELRSMETWSEEKRKQLYMLHF